MSDAFLDYDAGPFLSNLRSIAVECAAHKREKATFGDCNPRGDYGNGVTPMVMAIAGIVVGAIFAFLRLRVFVVAPFSLLFALFGVFGGIVIHAHVWLIVVAALGSVAAVQLTYAALGLMLNNVRLSGAVPELQAAIGQRLRAELEVPPKLSPELSALVARLP
jgi:hypothetical protein